MASKVPHLGLRGVVKAKAPRSVVTPGPPTEFSRSIHAFQRGRVNAKRASPDARRDVVGSVDIIAHVAATQGKN